MPNIKLYRHPLSGHSHRVELFISLLGLEAQLIEVDLKNGEHKQPAFLAKNSAGQVPVIEDADNSLADSNAILVYLAKKYDHREQWLPSDDLQQAQVQRFLSLSAGRLVSGPASARLVNVFGAPLNHEIAITISHALLGELDNHLAGKDWLVGQQASIADIANYTYIKHAPEGDISLAQYKNIQNWLTRIEALPGFIAMQPTSVGLAA
ncbi:glutathione S-transferase [Psychromonas sp. psych-6C06]|uniref:glutathione S-transferase family protein n=1 Tax=Psychromonas sp. psych-6C06 TaxID=2058089 RepID=UPI000C33D64D|nr:glutathione S-transferase [Psychromonas sp. psych-6C06]PKF60786.1 glutathione S-transferase [Psychromonas sp. psych-6C06]